MSENSQRLRDPVHDLIKFNMNDELDRTAWQVIQSSPFQRLRRIKQLGFSEFVYPGATHSRFSHSIGVFHVARKLVEVVRSKSSKEEPTKEKIALIAALVHDIGHGPFSHVFEKVGERFGKIFSEHETVSDLPFETERLLKFLTVSS